MPVGGHVSQKCGKLIDRIEGQVIASLVLIGEFLIPEVRRFYFGNRMLPRVWKKKFYDRYSGF